MVHLLKATKRVLIWSNAEQLIKNIRSIYCAKQGFVKLDVWPIARLIL